MRLPKEFNLEVFTHSNTAKRLNIPNIPNEEEVKNLKRLYELLKNIQARFSTRLGREVEIEINSAFRSKLLNSKIPNASTTSQHCRGEAVDIDVIDVSHDDTYNYIKALVKAKVITVGQVIKEYGRNIESEKDDWIHLSLGTKNEFLIKHPDKPYIKDLS